MSSPDVESALEQHEGTALARLLSIANHDFCPWANRYVYWLKQPIGWFVVATIASMLMAAFLEPRAWIIVGSLVAVIALGIVWPWAAIRGTTAEIEFDRRRCREGERVQVRLAIHNRWPWPLWGMSAENGFFVGPGGEVPPVAALASVPAWSRSEFVFEYQPATRGVYPLTPPELATGFPFGIWRAARTIAVKPELLVWPRTTRLTSNPSLGGDIPDVLGMMFDRPGNEGDVIGVRPFRDGDRLRSIHWAQTARRDALIVTERQASARRLVVVAVGGYAFPKVASPDGPAPCRQLEAAIRVAASIAMEFHAHHAEVRFVMGEIDMCLSPGTPGVHRLLDALARFQVERCSPRSPSDFGRGTLAVVVTSSCRLPLWRNAAGARQPLRLVLVDNLAAGDLLSKTSRQHAWIAIDSESDDSHQLRQQWERVCHACLAK